MAAFSIWQVRTNSNNYIDGYRAGSQPYDSPLHLGVRPWAVGAACVGESLLFDATDGAHPLSAQVKAAKAMCASCPALASCREEVMAEESGSAQHRFGVRAGMTSHERAALSNN